MDNWEEVSQDADNLYTERLRVPGGWLYRVLYWNPNTDTCGLIVVTFVPEVKPEDV